VEGLEVEVFESGYANIVTYDPVELAKVFITTFPSKILAVLGSGTVLSMFTFGDQLNITDSVLLELDT
jgi:hypothetical protein